MDVPGVGKVRTRYPIAPLHQEGEATWKEVQALKESVLDGSVDSFFNEVGLRYRGGTRVSIHRHP